VLAAAQTACRTGHNAPTMIYKFKSKATGDVIMLGPHGDQLLRLLGREPALKGIIEPARWRGDPALQAAVASDEAAPAEPDEDRRSDPVLAAPAPVADDRHAAPRRSRPASPWSGVSEGAPVGRRSCSDEVLERQLDQR
jgi:hypothetical protein